jgi:hypothetical protein
MPELRRTLETEDLKMLALLGRIDGPVLCDRGFVGRLLERGLVDRTAMGWTISPTGRMRLHMRR